MFRFLFSGLLFVGVSVLHAQVQKEPVKEPPECSFKPGEPAPDLDKLFQQTKGWIGGDGAYSVVISPKRTLWLFSDTFVGTVKENKRVDTKLVNNSVGVQEGQGKEAKMQFFVGGSGDKPEALFRPDDGKGYFWLQGGALVGEKLYIFAAQIEKGSEQGAFGFRHIGQWLCVVTNPKDSPAKWKIEQKKIPFTHFTADRHRSFGAAVLVEGDHFYIYGTDEERGKGFPKRSLIVARVPLKSVADFDSWRFFGSGEWYDDVKKCEKMSKNVGSELSVTYLPQRKRYVLVYTELGLSPRILAQTATTPWGPWTEAQKIYECPEMREDKKVFSYAAKAHPSLAGPDELVVSYVVNAFDFWSVFKDASLYWPRFIRVKIADAKP